MKKIVIIFSIILIGCGTGEDVFYKMKILPIRGLNLRKIPSLTGKIILTIPYGETVNAFREKGKSKDQKWRKVRYKKHTGWLYSLYLAQDDGQGKQINDQGFPHFFRSAFPISSSEFNFSGVNPSRVRFPLTFIKFGKQRNIKEKQYLKFCSIPTDEPSGFPRIGLFILDKKTDPNHKSTRKLIITVFKNSIRKFYFTNKNGFWFLTKLSLSNLKTDNSIDPFARFLQRFAQDQNFRNNHIQFPLNVGRLKYGNMEICQKNIFENSIKTKLKNKRFYPKFNESSTFSTLTNRISLIRMKGILGILYTRAE